MDARNTSGILAIVESPWAILPEKLEMIRDLYSAHLRGEKAPREDIVAVARANREGELPYEVRGNTAIIPVIGLISKRVNLITQISGGTSTQLLARDMEDALLNDDIDSIIMYVDSYGGTVDGTPEVAELIYQGREKKPIIAITDGFMASGAYWLGAAASRVFISGNTNQVGSIGVIATHVDQSKYDEKMGVKVTEIISGKFKNVGSRHRPLDKKSREIIQDRLDYIYTDFVESVAKFRGVSSGEVIDKMAEGRVFVGRQAINAGLVDGVSTIDALVNRLGNGEFPLQLTALSSGGVSDDETHKPSSEGEFMGNPEEKKIEINSDENLISPEDITAEYLADKFPDVISEFKEDAYEEGFEAGKTEELKRILSVAEQGAKVSGHEKLVFEMMFDGKTHGPEAATRLLDEEAKFNRGELEAIRNDSAEEVTDAEPGEKDGVPKDFMTLVSEHQESEGTTRADAIRAVARAYPEAHGQFIETINPNMKEER